MMLMLMMKMMIMSTTITTAAQGTFIHLLPFVAAVAISRQCSLPVGLAVFLYTNRLQWQHAESFMFNPQGHYEARGRYTIVGVAHFT